jgi:hypothetical protein
MPKHTNDNPTPEERGQELAKDLDASWAEHHRDEPEDYPAIRNMEGKKGEKS